MSLVAFLRIYVVLDANPVSLYVSHSYLLETMRRNYSDGFDIALINYPSRNGIVVFSVAYMVKKEEKENIFR